MNVKLLRKVKKHILEEPKRLYMRAYILKNTEEEKLTTWLGKKRDFPQCGTAACISGWACLLSGKRNANLAIGSDVLGLDYGDALNLFEPSNWPPKFKNGLRDDGTAETAKVAAARIEHFIKTKGAE